MWLGSIEFPKNNPVTSTDGAPVSSSNEGPDWFDSKIMEPVVGRAQPRRVGTLYYTNNNSSGDADLCS